VQRDRHQGAGGGSGGQQNRAAAWVSSLAMRSSTSSARKASKSTKCRCSTPLAKRTREAGKALAGVCVVDLLRVGVGAARRRVVRPRGVRRGRRRPGRAGRGLGARRAPRAGRAV